MGDSSILTEGWRAKETRCAFKWSFRQGLGQQWPNGKLRWIFDMFQLNIVFLFWLWKVQIFLQCILVSEEDEEATFVESSLRGRCLILLLCWLVLHYTPFMFKCKNCFNIFMQDFCKQFVLMVQVLCCVWSTGWILQHWLWCFHWNGSALLLNVLVISLTVLQRTLVLLYIIQE